MLLSSSVHLPVCVAVADAGGRSRRRQRGMRLAVAALLLGLAGTEPHSGYPERVGRHPADTLLR